MFTPLTTRWRPRHVRACTWVGTVAAVLFCGGAQAAGLGMVAILDGDAQLVREASRYKLEEGVALAKEDIVETGPQSRLTRLEFQDGTMLDLGPSARVMLTPPLPASRSKLPAPIYLLQGWVKWTPGKAAGALVSPVMDVQGAGRSIVAAVTRGGTVLAFAETGEWSVTERRDAGKSVTTATLPLKQEELYTREGPAKGKVLERPSAEFLQKMPHAFVDTLPSRMKELAPVAPKKVGEVAYADVQPWIDAEPVVRKLFVTRWRAKAAEPEFRKGLQAGMSAHPEWDRIVNPEKYQPKPQGLP